VRIEELKGWPPVPVDVLGDAPEAEEGLLVGSTFVPANVRIAAHLEVSIHHNGKLFKATFWHSSEAVLYLLSAALGRLLGQPMGQCRRVELFPRA
jgi:hypothetical protein